MKEHLMIEEYIQAFHAFLDHTTEKRDLFTILKRRILAGKAQTLLDIGAGDGSLAISLSGLVRKYVAVEPNKKYADQLRRAHLQVYETSFPWRTVNSIQFDVVLASHVVPGEEQQSRQFIEAAWNCVDDGGSFIMITYDKENSAWSTLLQSSGLPLKTGKGQRLDEYKDILTSVGALEVEVITTYVEAAHLDEMLLALSFVYSDGIAAEALKFQINPAVRKTIVENYRVGELYRFPFTHYLFQTKRAPR
jgi:precorrin-6B methylase 2